MKATCVVLRRQTGRVLCASLLLSAASTFAAADDNCQRLEELNRQYRGVALTADQKHLKAQMVAWYKKNCMHRHRASAGR